MKKVMLMLGVVLLGACKPFPAEADKGQKPNAPQVQTSTEAVASTIQTDTEEVESEPKPKIGRQDANNYIVSTSNNSNNYQSVTRVDDVDAVCWVITNTKSWEGSISCLPKSQLKAYPATEKPVETPAP